MLDSLPITLSLVASNQEDVERADKVNLFLAAERLASERDVQRPIWISRG